jgi:hypothetical protein
MVDAARMGRLTANSLQANAKRANTQRQNALSQHSWTASSQPAWLTHQVYSEKVQPLLARLTSSAIASSIGVSRCYAGNIRKGRYRPHLGWHLIREFEDIGAEAAMLLTKFCRDEESWIDFLRAHGEQLLPGDEDQQFFRSQAYRCLKYVYGGNGLYNLIQSVFNGTYCYWEGADGKFLNGVLIEPPFVYRDKEESRLAEEQSKSLEVRSEEVCEELYLAPGIAQVIVAIRATDECREARHALHMLRTHLGITTSDEISNLNLRLRALTHCFADKVLTKIPKPSGTISAWKLGFWVASTLLGGFATAAVGLTTDMKLMLHGVNALLNGANTFAAPVRNAVQSRLRAEVISNEMVRVSAIRSADFEVPPEIAALRQKNEPMSLNMH